MVQPQVPSIKRRELNLPAMVDNYIGPTFVDFLDYVRSEPVLIQLTLGVGSH